MNIRDVQFDPQSPLIPFPPSALQIKSASWGALCAVLSEEAVKAGPMVTLNVPGYLLLEENKDFFVLSSASSPPRVMF